MGKKVLTTALGMALVLGWWTLRDKIFGSTTPAASDHIPAKLWEGGGTTLTINVESSDPAVFRADFEATEKHSGTPIRALDTYERVPAGSHSWTIDVPSAVGGDLEFEAENPKPGSKLTWTVRSGNKVLKQESETLEAPLNANEAFFVKFDTDEFAGAGDQEQE